MVRGMFEIDFLSPKDQSEFHGLLSFCQFCGLEPQFLQFKQVNDKVFFGQVNDKVDFLYFR